MAKFNPKGPKGPSDFWKKSEGTEGNFFIRLHTWIWWRLLLMGFLGRYRGERCAQRTIRSQNTPGRLKNTEKYPTAT